MYMCVCVYIHTRARVRTYMTMSHMPPWSLPKLQVVHGGLNQSGNKNLGDNVSSGLQAAPVACHLTVHRRCLGGAGRQLPLQEVCDYFAIKTCPRPEGFHSRRDKITLSVTKP